MVYAEHNGVVLLEIRVVVTDRAELCSAPWRIVARVHDEHYVALALEAAQRDVVPVRVGERKIWCWMV